MLKMAVVGIASLHFMQGYDGLGVLLIMWVTPTVIGGFLCVLSGGFLLFAKKERETWQKMMLVGLWCLLVSGGSCGMLWAFNYSTYLILE